MLSHCFQIGYLDFDSISTVRILFFISSGTSLSILCVMRIRRKESISDKTMKIDGISRKFILYGNEENGKE